MKIFQKNILLFALFFLGFSFHCFSQAFTEEKADSILKATETIDDPFEKIKILTSNAGKNRYTKPTFKLITKAVLIAKKEDKPLLLAHSYYAKGNYYYYASKTDSSLVYLNQAQKFAKQSDDPILTPSILATKSGIYRKSGNVIRAISTNIEAQELLDKIDTLLLKKEERFKLKGQKLTLNNSLANLYNKTEDYQKALLFYEKAYQNAMTLGSIANASIILGNKGDLLIKINKAEEAISVIQKSKQMKLEAQLPQRFIGTSHLNMGLAYSQLKEYDKALKHYDSSYVIYTKKKYSEGLMRVTIDKGLLYNAINRPKQALLDCNKGKKIALETSDAEYTYKAYNCLYQANKSLENYAEALKNYEQYSAVKDSLFNEKNIRKITQVGMQYEFDKKNAEQELLIEKRKHQRDQVLAGIGILLLILIGSFVFFKKRIKYQKTIASQTQAIQKQKIKQLKQDNKLTALNSMIKGQEAERLRIANDLHDSLGGLLSTVKAHFTTIQKEIEQLEELDLTQKTNQLIDEACIEVRRISHNMMPHALSISGLEGAVTDLGEQLNEQGFQTSIEINNLPKNIAETKKIMMYRLVQEIISNITKHANAKSILIQLIGHNNELNLIIEDDGKGFDYNEAIKKDGLGLKSINSRVEFLDGTIDWDSQLNNGTSITINIPLS